MSEYLQLPQRTLLGKKVLLAGLSEAGKTAIRDVVFGGKSATEVEGYGATLNYTRMLISLDGGTQVTLMDLGGQKIFLERFVSKFSPFVFHSVGALIYVIDVSLIDRFPDAKHYFDAAVGRLEKYSPKTNAIFILIHKMDLLENSSTKEETLEQLRTLFQKDITQKIKFYETTIYNDSIKEAIQDLLKISFPDQHPKPEPAPTTPPAPSISAPETPASSQPTTIQAPTLPPTPLAASNDQDLVVYVNLPEIVRALELAENPDKIQEIRSTPEPEPEPIAEQELPSEFDSVVKALQFIETGVLSSEPPTTPQAPLIAVSEKGESTVYSEEQQPLSDTLQFMESGILNPDMVSQIQETPDVPEVPEISETPDVPEVPEIPETPETPPEPELLTDQPPDIEIYPGETPIHELFPPDILNELLPVFKDSKVSQLDLEDVNLPITEFDTHPVLDDEFDMFTAAEEIIKFLDATRTLFNLAFIAVKMSDGENLVHVGPLKYDDLATAVVDAIISQDNPNNSAPSWSIITADERFLLVEPAGKSLTIVMIGASISKGTLLKKIKEFMTQINNMVTITFSDMF